MLILARSLKNSFAPINRIPPEVLSLIPDHWNEDATDRDLITLTHVCRGWRTIFISRPSLWSYLDCSNIDKTRTYIERSKAAPLEICVKAFRKYFYTKEAFLLAVPHIGRLKYLSIFARNLPSIIHYFFCRAPLLEELNIKLCGHRVPILSDTFLDGNLPSLRDLRLTGVVTRLPWKNLSNLTTFYLCDIPEDQVSIAQLLDFFENAPLHTIKLKHSIPNSSDASPGRIVSLSSLKTLAITGQPAHSTLLDHLSIPTGASLVLESNFSGDTSPFLDHLPEPSENIKTLSRITTINLLLSVARKFLRLGGPNGETRIYSHRTSYWGIPSFVVDSQILRSLDRSILSTTKWLAISRSELPVHTNERQVFRTLSSMNDLRTLTLTRCVNLPFIFALNPDQSSSNLVICPKLEDLLLYVLRLDVSNITDISSMAKERAVRGAKLSSITIVGVSELAPGVGVFKLREHVERVDYTVDNAIPDWDAHPSESGDENE